MTIAAQHNVVIVAKSFNPTVLSQLWLTKNDVFSEAEVQGGSFLYTPMAVSLSTQDITFLAVPERIQLSFISGQVNHAAEIERTLAKIVKALPHTPFYAVGFNFLSLLAAKSKDEFEAIDRKFFLGNENPLRQFFEASDSRFGGYFSAEAPFGRLRLEIRPITITAPPNVGAEGLQVSFNFNHDLRSGEGHDCVLDFLKKWDPASAMANEMLIKLGEGWAQ